MARYIQSINLECYHISSKHKSINLRQQTGEKNGEKGSASTKQKMFQFFFILLRGDENQRETKSFHGWLMMRSEFEAIWKNFLITWQGVNKSQWKSSDTRQSAPSTREAVSDVKLWTWTGAVKIHLLLPDGEIMDFHCHRTREWVYVCIPQRGNEWMHAYM